MIKNNRNGGVLSREVVFVRGLLRQGLGLMFRSRLRDTGWVFLFESPSRVDVTNVFVFQSIDVLWLDSHGRVSQVRTVRPFTLHVRGVPGTMTLIELPAGAAQKSRTRVGDRLSWASTEKKPI